MRRRIVTSERLLAALAVGFLFAGGAAIPGAASPFELGEDAAADGADALTDGLLLGCIQFGQQGGGVRLLCAQEMAQQYGFGKGKAQGDHKHRACYDWLVTLFRDGEKMLWRDGKCVTSVS